MWLLLLPLLAQDPLERRILETEHSRAVEISALEAGLRSSKPHTQQLAVRAIGRLERAPLAPLLLPMLAAADAGVRRETVNALGQLKTAFPFADMLRSEVDHSVKAIILATVGRIPVVAGESETVLFNGLRDTDPAIRAGAARGLESLYRLNRSARPDSGHVALLRAAVKTHHERLLREYLMLTLNLVRDRDSSTIAAALADTSALVRRLAILAAPRWVEDPAYQVRYEIVRLAGSCDKLPAALNDSSEHVVLLAIDQMAVKRCDAAPLIPLVGRRDNWRIRSHALVALARTTPDSARPRLARLAQDSVWQARSYAAAAARLLADTAVLARLAADHEPNVVVAAMTNGAEAMKALTSNHNGLLFRAGQVLKGQPELGTAMPAIVTTLLRLHTDARATMRDAKMELLLRVRESGDRATAELLRPLLRDIDPEVARRTAEIITEKTGATTVAITTSYDFAPLPSEAVLKRLEGANAIVTMKGRGDFTIALLPNEAPASVATFVANAEAGTFNGLTIHRIVPNFLIQGGSPGADEYDGVTSYFMPEELGMLWHDRGTIGTSTRGHDTGDGQFYINLIDNFRLDNTYTLFGRVTRGMEVVDRIMEGDQIASIRIIRKN